MGQNNTGAPFGQVERSAGDIALEFLNWLDPNGTHALAAISPQGGPPQAATFPPSRHDEIPAWVDERDGRLNLYYSVNEPRADLGPNKAKKADITRLRAIFADLDPRPGHDLASERARIETAMETSPVPFGAIVDSGGGYQGLALLNEKMAATPDAQRWIEEHGRGLAAALGGDAVQNIDRVLRLPGTMNIPNEAKRAKGRVERQARLVKHTGARVTRDDIARHIAPLAAPVTREGEDAAIAEAILDVEHSGFDAAYRYDELPADLRARFENDLAQDGTLTRLWQDGEINGPDKSGSALRFKLAGRLKQLGCYSCEDYAALAWVWDLAGLQSKGTRDDVVRQLGRDWGRADATHAPPDCSSWFSPEAEGGQDATSGSPQRRRALRLMPFAEAAAKALEASAEPLVEGLLDRGTLSTVYGPSNSGKTFVVLDMAFAIACGRPWAGRETTRSGVLYLALEGGSGIRKRFEALHREYPDADPAGLMLATDSIDLFGGQDDTRAVIDAAQSIPGGCGLIVVDTLARAMAGGNEDTAADMGKLVRNVDTIRAATGAHVLLIHHSGKDTTRGARGSSALRAAVDTEIMIAGGTLTNEKQRDLEKAGDVPFTLASVHIGEDDKGRPVTSAVVRFGVHEVQPAASLSEAEREALDALCAVMSAADPTAYAPAAKVAEKLGKQADAVRKQLDALVRKGYAAKPHSGRYKPTTAGLLCSSPATHGGAGPEQTQGAEVHQFPQKTGKISISSSRPDRDIQGAIYGKQAGNDIFG